MNPSIRVSKQFYVGSPSADNMVLEGDNLDSLEMLTLTKQQSVDCIYIDPPYNTGNANFIYNDRFVRKGSSGQTSGWFSFMQPRLRLAKVLLKQDGVLFLSIDDRELANSLLLLDETFGSKNRIGIFCKTIAGGKNDSRFIKKSHEYLLVYGKSSGSVKALAGQQSNSPRTDSQLNKWGDNDRRSDRPNLYFPIHAEERTGRISLTQFAGSTAIFPIRSDGSDGCWRWSKQKVALETSRLKVKRRSNGQLGIYVSGDAQSTSEAPWGSVISTFPAGGGRFIKEKFGDAKAFTYAKNLDYMVWIIQCLRNKNATFLDFFAGSGTTGHAVMEANRIDGGSRKFILCGNSERTDEEPNKNICRNICSKRLKIVIKDNQPSLFSQTVEGFTYFKIDRLNSSNIRIEAQLFKVLVEMKFNAYREPTADSMKIASAHQAIAIGLDPNDISFFMVSRSHASALKDKLKHKKDLSSRVLLIEDLLKQLTWNDDKALREHLISTQSQGAA